jgi:hypothetical protein
MIVASILLVYQQAHCLCSVAYQLSSVCSVIHSAFRQVLLCPGTLDDLGTGGDRNAMQLKLALQDFGFMVALVVTECVLQYSLALSNLYMVLNLPVLFEE